LAQHVQERNLADRGGDLAILRGGGERIAAAHRGAERGDALRIDLGQRASERDGRAPVLQLAAGSNRSCSPVLSPKPRWSKTSAVTPSSAKRSANASSPSRRVPDRPCAITTIGFNGASRAAV